jgi:hypothetical protein
MDETFGFLNTVIERTRVWLDEPDLDAKYNDRYMALHIVPPAMADVLERLAMTYANPVVVRHVITLVDGQTDEVLPPGIGEIHRLVRVSADGTILQDHRPRGRFNPAGPGWELQGNMLSFRPAITLAGGEESLEVWYVPNGDSQPHYATDGNITDEDLDTFILSEVPVVGQRDRRDNAYAGNILRVFPAANGVIEERVIQAYDSESRTATLRRPFTKQVPGVIAYEVAPIGSEPLYEAISLRCAMKLGIPRGISARKEASLIREYQSAIKTIGDNLSNLELRIGKAFERDTIDSNLRQELGFYPIA